MKKSIKYIRNLKCLAREISSLCDEAIPMLIKLRVVFVLLISIVLLFIGALNYKSYSSNVGNWFIKVIESTQNLNSDIIKDMPSVISERKNKEPD